MNKIITLQKITQVIKSVHNTGKSIVLVGGCFDILHIGHIKFLEEAKKMGDILFVLLENDSKVRKLKGKNRPYFAQKERAQVLASLSYVDYVILLAEMNKDRDYEQLVMQLKPDIIAVTENDPLLKKKKHQADVAGSRLKTVPFIKTFSSSRLAKILGME
ncbi:adenylyltransferase/cytidyltransferase family protein [Candidatus Gottesmanbacteria bacterium]|nr:adenylyltransferase/cytidyltransferase family protein [Candidatus Gottesmanbacteria bacterium]